MAQRESCQHSQHRGDAHHLPPRPEPRCANCHQPADLITVRPAQQPAWSCQECYSAAEANLAAATLGPALATGSVHPFGSTG